MSGRNFFTPHEGYLMKFKKVNQTVDPSLPPEYVKCFINVLHADEIPPPEKLISEEELGELIDADLPYDIPFVLCPSVECVRDNSDENAMMFDATVNSSFLHSHLGPKNIIFRNLLTRMICRAIKEYHSFTVNPWEAIYLTKKKSIGFSPDAREMRLNETRPTLVQEIEKPSSGISPIVEDVSQSPKIVECSEEEQNMDPLNMYSSGQNDRVRMRIIDGKTMEIRIKVDSLQGLHLSMSRHRLLLRSSFHSIADFHFCVPIDNQSCKTKTYPEKGILEITADVVMPN